MPEYQLLTLAGELRALDFLQRCWVDIEGRPPQAMVLLNLHAMFSMYQVRPLSEKEKQSGTRCIISMSRNQTKILNPAFFDSENCQSILEDRSMW